MVTPDTDKDKGKHRGGAGDKAETAYGEEIKECPECGSKNLIRDYGKAELFCSNCGLVVAENIVDLGPEWRAFDFEQVSRRARVGAPMTYRIHDKGLSTLVTWCPSGQGQYKLKKWQQRTHIANTTERSFIFALSEIDRMACALRLPINIREAASMLYRKAMKKRLIRRGYRHCNLIHYLSTVRGASNVGRGQGYIESGAEGDKPGVSLSFTGA
jgi:transcription initiation factor TFIIB